MTGRHTSKIGLLMVTLGLTSSFVWASEPSCFNSLAAAAAQSGVRGVEGFRLESVQQDTFSGATWATIRKCGHPEQPAVMMVVTSSATPLAKSRTNSVTQVARALVMQAGSRVRLVASDDVSQVEVGAVAQASGALGDRVRVRLVPVSGVSATGDATYGSSNERFAVGVVRSSSVVESVTP